jgi:signal transduction histidine kinase
MRLGAVDYVNKERIDGLLLERTLRYAIEHAQTTAQLRQYAVELEGRNNELDAYNHTIAHDLSSPLSLIAGYASLILMSEEDTITPEIYEWAEKIRTSAEKMSDMINQLLWLAQLRSPLENVEPVDLNAVVHSALLRFEGRIKEKQIQIEVAPNMPIALGHAAWIEEAFANLISNSIKYLGEDNPAPCLQIRAKQQGLVVLCEVEDNGIGIKPEDQKRLFEMFTRVPNPTERIKGLGLGLAIVRRVVTRLGGEVGVESTFGEGSTFWFTLPCAN